MVVRRIRRKRLLSMLLGLAAVVTIPACASHAPPPMMGDGQIAASPPPRRFALRPRFANREPRPLFLSGYAGLSYPPGPRGAIAPPGAAIAPPGAAIAPPGAVEAPPNVETAPPGPD